ncbi:MAG: RlmE family RNA methyltransferase [Myxococcales bacterium]|nr:RlmE family RNA methyltransferase [Myxococcales bacterium]
MDLGCAPGSWLQYLSDAVGKKGAIVGYDIVDVRVGAFNVRTFVANVRELTSDRVRKDLAEWVAELKGATAPDPVPPSFGADLLVSDMAPKLTGIRDADQARSVELVQYALQLAEAVVSNPDGKFAAKLFQGRDTDAFLEVVKKVFRTVKLIKPEATREGSREVFVVGETKR